jgi:hypothetical protein
MHKIGTQYLCGHIFIPQHDRKPYVFCYSQFNSALIFLNSTEDDIPGPSLREAIFW